MPHRLADDINRAVLVALCRDYYAGVAVPRPASTDEMLQELSAQGVVLSADALRARLRRLCAAFEVEEGFAETMLLRLVEEAHNARVIPPFAHEVDDPPSHTLLERLAQRWQIVAGLCAAAVVLLVGGLVVLPGGGGSGGDGPTAGGLDPVVMENARGVVRYCTGDVRARGSQPREAQRLFNGSFGPDLKMQLVGLGEQADQQYEKFSQHQVAKRNACDVLHSDVIWTADFVRNGWLLDLSRYIREKRGKDKFIPTMLDAAKVDGKTWGVPKVADVGLLFYRKDRVARAPTTWQELYKAARVDPKRRLRYQGRAYEGLTVNFLELAYAAGAEDVVTPTGNANINQVPAQVALQFMVNGIRKAVPYDIVNQKEEQNQRAFKRGNADFMRNWPSYKATLNTNAALRGRVGVAPLPAWRGGGRASVLGGHILVISKYTKNPGAALKLVDYLTSESLLKRDAIKFSLLPALDNLWNDRHVQKALPIYEDLRKQIDSARLRPLVPNYQAVSRAIYVNVNRALTGEEAPGPALEAANFQMQQALEAG